MISLIGLGPSSNAYIALRSTDLEQRLAPTVCGQNFACWLFLHSSQTKNSFFNFQELKKENILGHIKVICNSNYSVHN